MNFNEMTKFLDSFLDMKIPGFACKVNYKGRLVFEYHNGLSSIEEKKPFLGNEKLNMYSCSKPITCVAALQLYEKGMYLLDDPLGEYIPSFKKMYVKDGDTLKIAKNNITIRQLFTMTAGFDYNLTSEALQKAVKELGGECPTTKTIEYLSEEPLSFEPGSNWQYSLCHDVLAAFIETLTGEKFGEYVRKNIFEPLSMNNSTFSLPDCELNDIAPQYFYDENDKKVVNIGKAIDRFKIGSQYESGGAGLVSNMDDYIKFIEAMRIGDVILSNNTLGLMQTNQLSHDALQATWYPGKYGYGLGVRCPVEGSTVTDFGWGGAAGSFLSVDRKNDITIFYSQHLINAPNDVIRVRMPEIAKRCIFE